MRAFLLVATVICSVSIAVCHGGGGGGKKGGKWMEKFKKCGDGEMTNFEDIMKAGKECKAEMKKGGGGGGGGDAAEEGTDERRRRRSPHDDEEGGGGGGGGGGRRKGKGKGRKGRGGWKKDMCVAVCGWKKQGVLKEDGSYDESGTSAFVDKHYPENKREEIKTEFKKCADDNSSSFSMENKCGGYKSFKKCMWKSHGKVCEIQFGGMGGMGGGGGGKGKGGGGGGGGGGGDDEMV